MLALKADDVDDVLYFARTNSVQDLHELLDELASANGCSRSAVIESTVNDDSGNSAAHYAAANGHVDVLNVIASAITGCDVTSQPDSTMTAPSAKDSALPSSILHRPNKVGNTPLHWAAVNGQLAAVKALMRWGADASTRNNAGHDAVFEAETADKEEVARWLLNEAKELESGISGHERDVEATGELDEDEQEAGPSEKGGQEDVDGMSGVELTEVGDMEGG